MMAILMGVPHEDSETLERAAELGIAFQLSNIARDVREDQESGRCYLPANWLAELQLEPESLFEPENSQALIQIVNRLIEAVRHYERSARRGVSRLPFRSRVAVLTALRIYGAIGRRVAHLGQGAWNERVKVGKLRKLAYVVPSVIEAMYARASAQ
jgi:phytoene synthase